VKTDLRHAIAIAAFTATALSAPAAQEGTRTATVIERTPAQAAQQDRMRRCNAEAKEKSLKGDERRAFMSACLKS